MLSCKLCSSSDIQKISTYLQKDKIFDLYHCNACLIQFWTPFENPGAEWYERDERYAGRNESPLLEPNWNHKKVISFLAPLKGKVLDIGCGTGNFLAHAQKSGWDTYGIDFDKDAIEVSKKVFHLDHTNVVDVVSYAQHATTQFDLITFFDVLEHVDNHDEFMNSVKTLLKPKGWIAMSMPYRGGMRWLLPHDLPPRHLTRWNREALTNFLIRYGFRVVYIKRKSEGIRFLILKLRFRYGKYVSFNLVSRIRNILKKSAGEVRAHTHEAQVVKNVSRLAEIKDALIFGLPALALWVILFISRKGCVTLYAIAQRND